MEKSLLMLLKKEDDLVRECNTADDRILIIQKQRDATASYPDDCEAKERDLARYDAFITENKEQRDCCVRKLEEARAEIYQYLAKALEAHQTAIWR